ncbi:unnamed protein product [Calypogeia fissa]
MYGASDGRMDGQAKIGRIGIDFISQGQDLSQDACEIAMSFLHLRQFMEAAAGAYSRWLERQRYLSLLYRNTERQKDVAIHELKASKFAFYAGTEAERDLPEKIAVEDGRQILRHRRL